MAHNTLCWNCEKACKKCSWSKNFIPVPGWKAIPTKISCGYKYKKKDPHIVDSFDVYECPEFELLQSIKDNFGKPNFNTIEIKQAVVYYQRLVEERRKTNNVNT